MSLEPEPELDPLPQRRRAPQVLDGTWLSEETERQNAFERQVEDTRLRPELWTGAFATNVWGGRYEMEGLLGEGGQGTTFFGTDLKTGAQVVAKVFDVGQAADWKQVDLFEREVQTLKRLEHDRIPTFMDVVEDDASGARALVMTRIVGENLHATVETGGPLPEARLWRVLIDVVEVLSFLHQQGLVHRDLKPKNLIREQNGEIHLVDFGGVGVVTGQKSSTVVGTFGYMAPEQLYGTTQPSTDLYALGATLLSLATGKEPEDLPRKGLSIDVDQAAPHLSEPLRELLTQLLTPDPEHRPPNAMAVAKELQGIYARTQAPASSTTTKTDQAKAKPKTDKERGPRMHESPHVDAVFDEERMRQGKEDFEMSLDFVSATLRMVFGILGSVAALVVGEVLIPLVLTLIGAFTQGTTRLKVKEAELQVKQSAKNARTALQKEAERGARALNEANHKFNSKKATRRRQPKHRPRPKKGRRR